MRPLASLARRAGWNIVDQALSALGNMLLMVVVAREVDGTAFGAFAIGFLVFGIAVAFSKALGGQPLQIRHTTDSPEQFARAAAQVQGFTVWLGVAIGAGTALVGAFLPGPVGAALLAVAVCLPGLLVQDVQRMAFFANGRAEHAALIDLIKTVVQFALLFALLGAGLDDVGLLTLSWGLAACVSAATGCVVLSSWPALLQARAWWRRHRDLSGYLVAEYAVGLGAAQIGTLLVPVLGTTRDAGSIRAGQTLLGPLNVLGTALLSFAVPEVSRHRGADASARLRGLTAISGGLTVVTLAYAGALLVLPEPVGRALFGDSWAGAAGVLLPLGVNAVASALNLGPGALLLGMGLARKTLTFNLVKGPVLLALLIPGTLLYGATGAAWALAVTEAAVLPFWFRTAYRAAHGHYDHLVLSEPTQP